MKLAPCPDCGNACSLTATTCPRCGRNMKSGDLSEFNAIKPVNSQTPNILIYVLAVISGLIGSIVAGFVGSLLGIPLMLSACAILLALGALFGFVWSNVGWMWGLWLVAVSNIIWFLVTAYMSKNSLFMFFPFFVETLPPLVSSCIGAYIGAKYKQRQHINNGVV
ncbi:MAG: hypothetical protein ACR2J3_01635 [Aridibacter sp.]